MRERDDISEQRNETDGGFWSGRVDQCACEGGDGRVYMTGGNGGGNGGNGGGNGGNGGGGSRRGGGFLFWLLVGACVVIATRENP